MESQLSCLWLVSLWVVRLEVAAFCQSLCRGLNAPTQSACLPLAPGLWLTMFKASCETHRSVPLDHTAVRKACEMPPWEQDPFAWEMQWGSVPCSPSLPELCCRSALPGHQPCWTWPNSLGWLSGLVLNLPYFYRCVWKSLPLWLTLITVFRPALLLLGCCRTEPLLVKTLSQLTLLSPSLLACPPQESSLLLRHPDNLKVSNKIKILLEVHKLH